MLETLLFMKQKMKQYQEIQSRSKRAAKAKKLVTLHKLLTYMESKGGEKEETTDRKEGDISLKITLTMVRD